MDFTNLKKLCDVAGDLGTAIDKMIDDQGGKIAKLTHLVPLSGDLMLLAGEDWSALKAEIAALDDAGKQALVAEFMAHLQLDQASVEAKIQAALALGVKVESMIEEVIGLAKSFKAVAAPAPAAPAAPKA